MIPIALVLGLAVGRWWIVVVAAVGWAAALVASGVIGIEDAAIGAAGLAAADAAVGAAIHKGVAAAFRLARNDVP
jgi:hypothetical protein